MRTTLLGLLLPCTVAIAVPTLASLSARGLALRQSWGHGSGGLAHLGSLNFDSAFYAGGTQPRDWANWLVPGRLMVGQYPSVQPAVPGPSLGEADEHMRRCLLAGVDGFVCLQEEVPPQDATHRWTEGGIPLPGESASRFPGKFRRYAADADRIASELGADDGAPRRPLRFLHCPIEDLNVPADQSGLLLLFDACLSHYEAGGGALYVHCWGGRGRAGLVGSSLLSLLWPGADGETLLALVQRGYAGRAGAESMRRELQRSPQTEAQRTFVQAFSRDVRFSRLSELGIY